MLAIREMLTILTMLAKRAVPAEVVDVQQEVTREVGNDLPVSDSPPTRWDSSREEKKKHNRYFLNPDVQVQMQEHLIASPTAAEYQKHQSVLDWQYSYSSLPEAVVKSEL